MIGVEIDFVVQNCLEALPLYESIFEVESIEATHFPPGRNEAVFSMYGTRFHMLDEVQEAGLVAPRADTPLSMWVNIVVPDIKVTYEKAITAGCKEIQSVKELDAFGVSNAIFCDPFGYIWMLHQVHREVSFEDRCKAYEEMGEAL
jgi:PhnB protein